MFILLTHQLTTVAKLLGTGGTKAVIAENLLLKQQLLVVTRSRHGDGHQLLQRLTDSSWASGCFTSNRATCAVAAAISHTCPAGISRAR